jgi:putative tricarboxylic transport membrane protein
LLELFGLDAWWPAITALVAGTALGFAYGLIPGIGGRIGVILSMPLAAFFDPYPAAIFLFALHAITNTSSSIPNIALGMPTSSSDAATILDGYPLTKMGRGGEALGASLSASAIGGVLGALAFLAAIPVARPLVTSFGPPEILMLALIGITMVASLSSEGLLQGLVVAALGIIVAMIGLDHRTGEPRFTFGLIDLWDGVGLPAIVCGLFVIPEMLTVKRHDDEEAFDRAVSTRIADVYRGMFVTLRYRAVLLRSTLYGILVGLTPSVGSSVSVWMSYAYAARTTKSEIPFGKGAIAGVIAPEAANNSKEGGAMIPTLFFGIPGSSGMAVMMGALAFVGVSVGPNMLTTDIGLSFSLVATIFLANLLAVPMFFAVVPAIVRLSALRYEAIVPVAITVSVTAALIDAPTLATIVQLFIGATVGIGLKLANWPRAPFVLGFVIAGLAEGSYFVTAYVWGWSALARPMTIFLLVVLIGWLLVSLRRRSPLQIVGPKLVTVVVAAALIVFFAITFALSLPLQPKSGLAPMAVSIFGAFLTTLILMAALRQGTSVENDESMHHIGITGLFVAATPIVGITPASLVYITVLLRDAGVRLGAAILVSIICCVLQVALLASVFDILIEREIIGRVFWAALGYQ